ncbi:MAG: hypothetical protein ACYTHN_14975 [Planctomycetota bacterium]|jgi:hypothetical protein
MAGKIDEGIEAMRTFFKDRRKLTASDFSVLRSRYPRLAKDKRFKAIQK